DRLDRGEERAQAALGRFRGIERLDERAERDLVRTHGASHGWEGDWHHLYVPVRHEAGVEQGSADPEIVRGLESENAGGAALEIFHALHGGVVLDHVRRREPVLAVGLQADPREDLNVEARGGGEDHGETWSGAAVELVGEVGLEALGVALERDELEPILRALTRREIGPRRHEPHLLFGGEAVAEPDQRGIGGVRRGPSERDQADQADEDEREATIHGVFSSRIRSQMRLRHSRKEIDLPTATLRGRGSAIVTSSRIRAGRALRTTTRSPR